MTVAMEDLERDEAFNGFLRDYAVGGILHGGLTQEVAAELAILLASHLLYFINFEIHRRKTFWVSPSLAYLLAFQAASPFRGVAAIDAASVLPPPENDPTRRLAIYLIRANNSRQTGFITLALRKMREARLPVTEQTIDDAARSLATEDLTELARWMDTLDRI